LFFLIFTVDIHASILFDSLLFVFLRQFCTTCVGDSSPLFYWKQAMIDRENIEKRALEALSDEMFLVGISVRSGNVIDVYIDSDQGLTIEHCVSVSRYIEQHLNRDEADFELNVSSPGLGKPFQVYRQYIKNEGERVEVTVPGEKPVSGILKNVRPEGFDLEIKTIEKSDGKKKKVEVIHCLFYGFDQKPEVKNIISFK